MMRRRQAIAIVAGVLAWPISSGAQRVGSMPRIAVLMGLPRTDVEGQRWMRAFIQALRDLGWRNGADIQIELRWAGDLAEMRDFASQLVALQPQAIVTSTILATSEVLRQTKTIPVVFTVVNDPVASGFTRDLEHPDGNATGFTNIVPNLAGKWIELLKEIVPATNRVAVLFNPTPGAHLEYRWPQMESAASAVGIELKQAPARNLEEVDAAVAGLAKEPGSGFVVMPDSFFNLTRSGLIAAIAARHRVAAVYPSRDFVVGGGLASYSVDLPDLHRRAAAYVDRILKGAKPADLPIEPPTKLALTINLKTAKTLGLTFPASVRQRATEIIE